jgi:transglutaminase-like putative cysteine protease
LPTETYVAVLIDIRHTTCYRYSTPVFLEPHTVRLRPRCDGTLVVERFKLDFDPQPTGTSQFQDAEGNLVTRAWFNDVHSELTIAARCTVRTTRTNPFDFLLPPPTPDRLLEYGPELDALLAPARKRGLPASRRDPVRRFTESIVRKAEFRLVPFLVLLTDDLFHRCRVVHREQGAPWPPDETWQRGSGACRDLAVLMVDACRSVGLAARFVSGCQEGDREQDRRELHAWAEVYIPGAGWRGFDPTHGLAVADRHVPLAAGVAPESASPVTGSFRGTGAESTMETELAIDVLEPAEVA